jgi:hypothetical protein
MLKKVVDKLLKKSPSKKKITHRSRKAKGRRLQQNVAALISITFELSKLDVVSTPMGSNGVDIMLSSAAREKFPYAVECKNQETASPSRVWWEQSVKAGKKEDLTPVLFVSKNGKPIYAIYESADKASPIKKAKFWEFADGKSFNFMMANGLVLRATPIQDFLEGTKHGK